MPTFNDPLKSLKKKLVGIGGNSCNQHFLLFPQGFLPFKRKKKPNSSHIETVVCKCFRFGEGYNFVVWYSVIKSKATECTCLCSTTEA